MRWWQRYAVLFVICGGCSMSLHAGELTLQSGPAQTVMIELYTSEGCSSCPPAEHFLNRLVYDQNLWQTYIPLAFHVDYWDYLGWRDRFASPANSRRQRTYAKVSGASTVYTPEFFVNGREWRRGVFDHLPSAATNRVGILKVKLKNNRLLASFAPTHGYPSPLQLHVALLGMDLASHIRSGENAGRQLRHQFVVLDHIQATSDTLRWQAKLPISQVPQDRQQAVVVWVSQVTNPRPLQAVGGYLAD